MSLRPQRFGFIMSFSIPKSRSTAALEAAARREILKEGRVHQFDIIFKRSFYKAELT